MAVLLGGWVAALGQAGPVAPVGAAAALPVFDVVSVKPNRSGGGGMSVSMTDDERIFTNVSLSLLIYNGYGMRPALVYALPEWGKTEHWDVTMKVSGPEAAVMRKLDNQQSQAMQAAVLEDRFKLKVHRETRELPVYDLVVAKGGLRMKASPVVPVLPGQEYDPAKPGGGIMEGGMRMGNGMIVATYMPVASLIESLSSAVDRAVVNRTGLLGKYDLTLKYSPEGAPETDDAPSIFTALEEQLGLKLVPAKGPMTVLVVDHAERPAEN